MPEIYTVWRVVRVHHVTYLTQSLMTLFGGRLRKHRFQPAKSRLYCLEVMVKDPTEQRWFDVAREAFSVERNRPGHIRRIPHPGDSNFCRRCRWKGFEQQNGQVQWSGDYPYTCTHHCGNEWRMVLSSCSVCWRSRKENHCNHQWTPWDNLPLPEAFRITPTRQCSSIQQHLPRDLFFSSGDSLAYPGVFRLQMKMSCEVPITFGTRYIVKINRSRRMY